MESNLEIWKDIPGYEGMYQCSSFGRVRSLDRYDNLGRFCNGIVLKQMTDTYGYNVVNLYRNRKVSTKKAYKLVAICFLGHIPCGYKQVVNHIDGDRTNNKLNNLEVCTQRHNVNEYTNTKPKTSIFNGVNFSKKKWVTQISVSGIKFHLGYYTDEFVARDIYLGAVAAVEKNDLPNYLLSIKKQHSSIYKGVTFEKRRGTWVANKVINGKNKYIGSYRSELEAHTAYTNYVNSIGNSEH